MAEIYVFEPDAEDLTTHGLCGALEPTECIFTEEANGMSEIRLTHPVDSDGFSKYAALERGRLLVCDVPVRTTPEIDGTQIVTQVEVTTIKNTATKGQRTLYTKRTRGKKKKVVPRNQTVVVVQKNENWGRYKIKTRKWGTNWIDKNALNEGTETTIADTTQSIESVATAWTVEPQIFRIYEVEKDMDSVSVRAQHITYDLIGNVTYYLNTASTAINTAIQGILDGCVIEHDFEAYTNLANTVVGVDYRWVNPVTAFLDPDTGITARYGCSIIRDNYEIFFLDDPGMNRGVTVSYKKNLTGVKASFNCDDVITQVIPVGKTKKKQNLYLDRGTYSSKSDTSNVVVNGTNTCIVNSPSHLSEFAEPHAEYYDCSSFATVSNSLSTANARLRMYQAAQRRFSEDHADEPKVDMTVEFVNLGDTAEYAEYRNLENLYLYDYVTIKHPDLGIAVTAQITSIEWDVQLERMVSMDIGTVTKTLADTATPSWQVKSLEANKIIGEITSSQIDTDGLDISVYSVVITSSSGDEVSDTTTLTANVFYGTEDVTSNFENADFTWYKDGAEYPDAASCHVQSVTVQYSDMMGAAQFVCELDDTWEDDE